MEQFPRIKRLPPYVFNITGELKAAARKRGEDVIDFGMGNPDQPTPEHIVDKLVETARRADTHGYSVSKASCGCAKRSATGTSAAMESSSTPSREAIVTIGSKEGIAHLGARDPGGRRYRV